MRIDRFFEDPKRSNALKKMMYLAMAFFFALDFAVPRHHAAFPWDEIPGFLSVYGFLSCVVIIVVSKFIGHRCGIMKGEDYYD